MEICIDEGRLKQLVKEAVFEALKDQRQFIYDVLAEVVEDMALVRAIKEGENTGTVDKERIFDVLDGRP
ncbi:MAG: hypothetical protein P4L55_11425 [Syntrophobacteraceae bacterium]|nr:hypothetical protein [Syntrophobacteraceae bacterium]